MGRRGGGRRREEGEGTKHGGWTNRDREMYMCACVFSVCLCARVCACTVEYVLSAHDVLSAHPLL